MAASDLTAERLRQLLSYDPNTGRFTRLRTGRLVGDKSKSGYTTVYVDGASRNAHRLAWLHYYGEMPKNNIDHINGDRSDNRICNLRDVPQSINIKSKHKAKGASGVKGVNFHKGMNRWVARSTLTPLGPVVHLGSFRTMEEAKAAYDLANG